MSQAGEIALWKPVLQVDSRGCYPTIPLAHFPFCCLRASVVTAPVIRPQLVGLPSVLPSPGFLAFLDRSVASRLKRFWGHLGFLLKLTGTTVQ